MIEFVIFDFNRTIFDPETNTEMQGCTLLLDCLREAGIKISIVSRKEKDYESRRQLIESQSFITDIKVYYVEFQDSKQSAFDLAMKEFSISEDKILVVGDHLESDIQPALELGIKTVWFRNGKFADLTPNKCKIYPTHQVSSLIDILPIIKSYNS